MVGLIADFLQLGSKYLPGSPVSSNVAQAQCRIYRGWPIANALTSDLEKGIANITVFPVAGAGRRTTRYVPKWIPVPTPTPSLTASVSGSDVVITGEASASCVIGIRFGAGLDPSTYTYRPLASDTPETIASAFGQMIPHSTVTGPVLTIPGSGIETVVAPDQSGWMETRRQEAQVWVIGWCPRPDMRDRIMSAVDGGFANLTNEFGNLTDQFPLPDGSSARLLAMNNHTDDQPQRANLWRRDLRYVVSYPTTLIQTFPSMIFGQVNLTDPDVETVTTVVGPTL